MKEKKRKKRQKMIKRFFDVFDINIYHRDGSNVNREKMFIYITMGIGHGTWGMAMGSGNTKSVFIRFKCTGLDIHAFDFTDFWSWYCLWNCSKMTCSDCRK